MVFQRNLWKKLRTDLNFSSTHHLQTDGQIEVVNRSLGNLLSYLVGDKPKGWDLILPQVEFSYNNFLNRSIGRSPFQIVYGSSPRTPPKLRNMEQAESTSVEAEEFAEHIKHLHQEVHAHITKMNQQYKLGLIKGGDIKSSKQGIWSWYT